MSTEVQKIKRNIYNNDEQVTVPPVDIFETTNEYVIKADMPGVGKENVEITLNENKLEIIGRIKAGLEKSEDIKFREYYLHNYNRTFNVGNDIDVNRIVASMNDGVLTLTMSKKEEVKPKKIEIRAE